MAFHWIVFRKFDSNETVIRVKISDFFHKHTKHFCLIIVRGACLSLVFSQLF